MVGARVDARDAAFDPGMARIENVNRAVGDGDALRLVGSVRMAAPEEATLADEAVVFAAGRRSRRRGTLMAGRLITSSVISGRPDHRLASVTSA